MKEILEYSIKQFEHFFPDGESIDRVKMGEIVSRAHERALNCFSHTHAYKNHKGRVNYLHGDQYATYLYFLSNESYQAGYQSVYYKSALLNKCLHGIDLFGHIEMPEVFLLVHPMGTIVGRATIGERIVIYQGVTIGGKHTADKINYPVIGDNVSLFSNSSIIGDCRLGDGAIVAANAQIIDVNVQANEMITGSYPNNTVRALKSDRTDNFFL